MVRKLRGMLWLVGLVLLTASLLVAPGAGAQAQAQESKPAAAAGGAAGTDFGPDYLLGPGDLIDIAVWKDETLTKSLIVLPDGKISFPLIGEIRAAGRTVAQLKQEIAAKISPYAPDPTISVEVRQVNSMLIYVIGRVNTPGRFALNTNVNVLQALTMAGGLNAFAKRDKIRIFRQEGQKTTIIRFKYDEVVEGSSLEQNIILQRGDLIVVP
ncbi:MAG: polysaccharide biosynthesis/export family protein [Syntrophales bacterium LBB04]|nr:polysaccharide biosynthesis/export family protein [Syntrophales bacterium LBB04]